MAAKRITPDVESLGQAEVTPTSGTGFNIVGAAGPPVGPSQLSQIADALGDFNPALQKFGYQLHARKEQRSAEEAAKYFDEIEQSVGATKIRIKRDLKKLGYSDWDNPEAYRQQLINTGRNTATKDVESMLNNKDFTDMMNALMTSSSPEDFRGSAEQLIYENFKPAQREAEDEKVGHYFEMGYGASWVREKNKYLDAIGKKQTEYAQAQLKRDFYESASNEIKTAIESGTEASYRQLRKFFNTGFAGFPEAGKSYSKSLIDNAVMPTLMELARNPDNELNVETALTRILSMTRENGNGGRSRLFKGSDLSDRDGRQNENDLREQLYNTQLQADKLFDQRHAAARTRIFSTVNTTLNNWVQWQENNEEFAKKHNIYGLDAGDSDNAVKIASALALHPDFKLSIKQTDEQIQYMFADAVQDARRKVMAANVDEFKTEAEFNKELMASLYNKTEFDSLSLIRPALPSIERILLDPNLTAAEAREQLMNEALTSDNFRAAFFTDNQHLDPNQLIWQQVLRQKFDNTFKHDGIQAGYSAIELATAKLHDPYTTPRELNDISETLQAFINEIDDPDVESKINATLKGVEQRLNLDEWVKTITPTDINTIVTTGLVSAGKTEISDVLSKLQRSAPDAADSQTPDMGALTPAQWQAATFAHNTIKADVTRAAIGMAQEKLANIDYQLRDAQWPEVRQQILAELTEYTKNRAGVFEQNYADKLNLQTKAAGKTAATEQTLLLEEDIQLFKGYTDIQNSFKRDETFGIGGVPMQRAVDSPAMLTQFLTGPQGYANQESLVALKKKYVDRKETLEEDLFKMEGNMKENAPSQTPEQRAQALKDFNTAKEHYKDYIQKGEILSWKELNKEGGLVHTINTGEAGQTSSMSLVFNPETDDINLNSTLVYQDISELKSILEATNTFEDENGGESGLLDRDKAPQDVLEHANFLRRVHGFDILAKSPADRKAAMANYTKLAREQYTMLSVRHPDKMPASLLKRHEDVIIEEYIESDFNHFQGQYYTQDTKDWVGNVYLQNKDVLGTTTSPPKFNLEDGITASDFTTMRDRVFGTVAPVEYIIEKRGDNYFLDRDSRELDDAGLDFPDALTAERFKTKPYKRIAQEIALAELGVLNPILAQRDGFFKEGWQTIKDMLFIESDEPRGVNRYLRIEADKYKRLQERQQYYEKILKEDSPITKHPDLARAFNKLLLTQPNYFQLKFGQENRFGVMPLPIPHK
tara:strand:+ start:3131 stop:6799 length:3669 start_codon:yes stop_codon:yes gene_type:complete